MSHYYPLTRMAKFHVKWTGVQEWPLLWVMPVLLNSLEVLDFGILISTSCKTGLNTLHPWDNHDNLFSHFWEYDSIFVYIAKQSPQYRPQTTWPGRSRTCTRNPSREQSLRQVDSNITQRGALHKKNKHRTFFHKETLNAEVMLPLIPTALLCLDTCVLTTPPRFMEPSYLV